MQANSESGMNGKFNILKSNTDLVYETPEKNLLLKKESIQVIVDRIRDIVENDVFLQKVRELLQNDFPQLQLRSINGVDHIVIYRSIQPNFDVAPTASAMTDRKGGMKDLTARVTDMMQYLELTDQIDNGDDEEKSRIERMRLGEDWFGKLARAHLLESDGSLFIPASTASYASTFYKDGLFLEICVPVKNVIPIYRFAEMVPQFRDEQEIAIAGKVEKEWVRVLDDEEKQEAIQSEKERLEQHRQKLVDYYEASLPFEKRLMKKLSQAIKIRLEKILSTQKMDILTLDIKQSASWIINTFFYADRQQDGRFFMSNIMTEEEAEKFFSQELSELTADNVDDNKDKRLEKNLYQEINVSSIIKIIDGKMVPVWTSFLSSRKQMFGIVEDLLRELKNEEMDRKGMLRY